MSTINSTFSGSFEPVVNQQAGEQQYATSEAQLEVWLSSTQSTQANCAYNEISSLLLRGTLNQSALQQALAKVVQRHASLRSTFSRDGQVVSVRDRAVIEIQIEDLSGIEPAKRPQALRRVIDTQARTPFNLVKGPLVRFVLQKIATDHHKLTVTAHHLVMDGWSLAVFCRELGHFYDVLSGVERPALPPANHYFEYAQKMSEYLASDQGRVDEAFWVGQFADQIPVLELPIERTRPALRTYSGDRYDHVLNRELVERVRKLGAKAGCSLFNTMLAAFNAYLARLSGNNDFCVGIPTAGQAALDQPQLIGHCVNTMPLRTTVDANATFVEHMKSTRSSLLDAFDHQCYSYGTLLRKLAPPRDPARPPMLNVSFNLDPMIDTSELGFAGLDVDVIIEPRSFENFEWFVNGVIRADKSVELQVQYNTDLYSNEAMVFYFAGFEAFLHGIVDNPQSSIADLHAMSLSQRRQVLVDWNASELDYPAESTLAAEFTRQATATPDRVAVSFASSDQEEPTQTLTYADVESQSNQIAHYLQQQGVVAGDLIGICVERNASMLVYLYGILKAGAGYVPLDPAYPSDRLQYMCDHSELKLIVTQHDLVERVATFNKPLVTLDALIGQISELPNTPIEATPRAQDICYVIYTSGSTGKPKGVQVPHGAVVNFLYAMRQTPGFQANDSVLAVTTLSFDISVLELFLPTIFGGQVVVADSRTAADGNRLSEQLDAHNISVMQATPATWRMMIQAGWKGRAGLKVLCGGEPMPRDLVGPLLERCDQLWNMYGPTETTVWSAAYQITSPQAPILIGKPIGNTQIYVLDAEGREVPAGCEGEIFIGGAGVTLGYRNQPELTDQRFVENRYRNPFADYVSDRLYKTGDLGRFCFDGNLQFLRRNDKQVKVRGFRIELGEIEQTIKSHPAVENCVVIVREDQPGDARLVAYSVTKPQQTVTAVELRDHLRQTVPYYMVPQHFVELDALPQTNNGKIDYKALPQPQLESVAATVGVELSVSELPTTPAEKYLAQVWQSVLQLEDICLSDTFFDIGGHSLLVMQVIAKVQEKTGIKLSPQDFLIATLEQIADKFAEAYELCDSFAGQQVVEESEPPAVATAEPSVAETSVAEGLGTETSCTKTSVAELSAIDSSPLESPAAALPHAASSSLDPQTASAGDGSALDQNEATAGVFRRLKGFWS